MTLFLTASSFYSIFTQVPKTVNSTVALQVGFLKHLRDIATVLLSLSQFVLFLHAIPDRLDDDHIRSLCGALAVSDSLCKQKSHWIITIKWQNECLEK